MIIGMVVLIGVGVFIYSTQQESGFGIERDIEVALEVQPLHAHVTNCLQDAFHRGLYLSAIRGGKIFNEEYVLQTVDDKIPFYLHYQELYVPSPDLIKSELERYIAYDAGQCIEYSDLFESFNVSIGAFTGDISAIRDGTQLIVSWPIQAVVGGKLFGLDEFFVLSKADYFELYQLAIDFVSNQVYTSIAPYPVITNPSVEAKVFPYDEGTIIYTLTDFAVEPPMVFMFATRKLQNSPPKLDPIPDFTLRKGEAFGYKVKATDPDEDMLVYSADTDKILLNPSTGKISFTPYFAGKFTATITVTDAVGQTDSQKVIFRIDPQLGSERIVADGTVSLQVPVRELFIYDYPAYSTAGETLSCSTDIDLFRFTDGCKLVIEPYYNLVEDYFTTKVEIKDSSGYSVKSTLNINFVESRLFVIESLDTLYATKGVPYEYQVKVTRYEEEPFRSQPLTYSDDSSLFDIDQNGWIRFTAGQTGSYSVTVTVSDKLGNSREESFELVIDE
jgi:hypothetical protein